MCAEALRGSPRPHNLARAHRLAGPRQHLALLAQRTRAGGVCESSLDLALLSLLGEGISSTGSVNRRG